MAAKTAFVTGGASGIGKAMVEMLAKRGVRVAIADANIAGARQVASTLKDGLAVELDAANWDSQLAAFQEVLEKFGRIDYVFGIAGVGEAKWIPSNSDSVGFAKPDLSTLDIDLNGVLYTSALAIQQMRRQEPDGSGFRGKIVLVASVCGIYCVPTLPIYTTAKHGVVGFVRSYGKHLPNDNITLNAICPDVVRTSISTEAFYEQMEAKSLIVPMEYVTQAFERCLDEDISGETLEIEPISGVTLRSKPEYLDKEAEESMKMLHQRSVARLYGQDSS